MASKRRTLLLAVRTRLRLITDWNVQFDGVPIAATEAVRIGISYTGENRVPANSEAYDCTLDVRLVVAVRNRDALPGALPDGDEGNPDLYMERVIEQLEAQLNSPDLWESEPLYTDAMVMGHDLLDHGAELRDRETLAMVHLQFTYQDQRVVFSE